MTELQYKKIKEFAMESYKIMTDKYKFVYNMWFKDMQVVAKEMGLTNEQQIYINQREIAEIAACSLEEQYKLVGRSVRVVVKERGNTKAIEKMAEFRKLKEKLEKTVCKDYYKEFDKRISKQAKKR